MSPAAIFLDRDGTINIEKNYLYRLKDWEWLPGAIEAILRINNLGYLAIVVTNQAGVARGYYSERDILFLHHQIDQMLAKAGAKIDAYYHCPHHPEFGKFRNCSCRKPQPGMLFNAQRDFDIDLSRSWLIGDKLSDIEAASGAGCSSILVMTGYGEQEKKVAPANVLCKQDILDAIKHIEELRH